MHKAIRNSLIPTCCAISLLALAGCDALGFLGSDEGLIPDFDPLPPSQAGDLNLNGIPNELADIDIFAQYLVEGATAFKLDRAKQAAATDFNGNKTALELVDFARMIRIFTKDELPLPKVGTNLADFTAELRNFSDDHNFTFTNGDMSTFLIEFHGDEVVSLRDTSITMKVFGANGITKVLFYLTERQSLPLVTEVFETMMRPQHSVATDYEGRPALVRMILLRKEFALFQNEPNPFINISFFHFSLSEPGEYTLTVKSLNGQVIDVISGEASYSGNVTTIRRAPDLPQGSYYLTLLSGGQEATILMNRL